MAAKVNSASVTLSRRCVLKRRAPRFDLDLHRRSAHIDNAGVQTPDVTDPHWLQKGQAIDRYRHCSSWRAVNPGDPAGDVPFWDLIQPPKISPFALLSAGITICENRPVAALWPLGRRVWLRAHSNFLRS